MMNLKLLVGTVFIATLLVQTVYAIPVIVGFHGCIDDDLIYKNGIEKYHKHNLINAISADIPQETIESLKKNPKIKYIEEDAIVQA